MAIGIILIVLIFLIIFVYGACVVAGRADEQMKDINSEEE